MFLTEWGVTVKKKLIAALSLVPVLLLASCSCVDNESKRNVVATKAVVVNVLDKEFYDDCHIKGSLNVANFPFENAEFFKDFDKSTPIVFYCSNYMCTGSGAAAQVLKDAGFTNVKAYEGGMAEWLQKGYSVEGPCKQTYLREPAGELSTEEGIEIITAEQLKSLMEESGLL
jgi:rhodanese-related sulfurtransferase